MQTYPGECMLNEKRSDMNNILFCITFYFLCLLVGVACLMLFLLY